MTAGRRGLKTIMPTETASAHQRSQAHLLRPGLRVTAESILDVLKRALQNIVLYMFRNRKCGPRFYSFFIIFDFIHNPRYVVRNRKTG